MLNVGKKPVYEEIDLGDTSIGGGISANFGTAGFQDFGSGTRATLHGSEMVLPERNVGELANELAAAISQMTNKTTSVTNRETATTTNNNTTAVDMTAMNTTLVDLVKSNDKMANHLNTLVTIGAMTEKNTKNTNNNLANMGGSLV